MRRRWPLRVALLLLALGAILLATAGLYLWLYQHRSEHPEFYWLRPYLEVAMPSLILFALVMTVCYGLLQRKLNVRPRWFHRSDPTDPSSEKPMNTSIRRRQGFTLVEMLVVIFIILLITALGAALLPRFLDNQMQTRAVDQLTQWLLTAKQRAKRDGAPTGLRILVNPTTKQATQLVYIQQPEPYTAGTCLGISPINGTSVSFQAGSVDFEGAAPAAGYADELYGDLGLVLAGDYLELNGGGSIFYIGTVNKATLVLQNTQFSLPTTTPTTNYRIIRQPRRLSGEDTLTLPQDMVIDFTPNPKNSNAPYSMNVPTRTIAGTNTNGSLTVYEVLFSPQGNLIGKGTPCGKVILWVRNATKPIADPGSTTLVAVQIHSGFIAAHPIPANPANGDYYLFTEDGKSSGL